ncbi:acetyl-CoA carboxylase biotin carboxylase subunit [Comamonas composti]|uniref:acetyl-CoA carboxylase biotin carboxylase subunit n=1 Tax=Comamonas composti TaxID=408558 RepID=UPI0003FF3FE7|nr:biotin carboxylase N-terminal domain-containing protein [Comamonas composti]
MNCTPHTLRRVLVANRGAVAARIIRTLQRMGLQAVAVYSEADADLPYVQQADESVCIGPPAAQHSYLNQARLLEVAHATGSDALHPGYGFLAENAGFAEAVQQQGLCFIGPSSHWISTLGHKTQAREFMAKQGMPQAPSSAVLDSATAACEAAARIGYPVLVKPAGGGGGIGMLPAHDAQQLQTAWTKASGIASKFFATPELYLEKLIEAPRHIEFQVLADRHGQARILFERDCSVQRRHQKIVEEARPIGIPEAQLAAMRELLQDMLSRIGYDVIGTVETLYTPEHGFAFLEMNTRLQVEHAVTEEITGIDIVEAQLRLAAGESMQAVLPQPVHASGHALQARIYAEDPLRFLPSPGRLEQFVLPDPGPGLRVETGYAQGCSVTPFYDPMLAKIVVHGRDRTDAILRLGQALAATQIKGVKTNIPFIEQILSHADFVAGRIDTGIVQRVLTNQTS